MKKIKIIGVITILVIVCETIFSFSDGARGFKKGAESARRGEMTTFHTVDVQPIAELRDSLFNTKMGCNVPYTITQVETYADVPGWVMLIMPFAFIACLCYLFGFYCLIRLLISVSRRDVFTGENVFRLRVFAYSQAAAMGLIWLYEWVHNYFAVQQLQLLGYEVMSGTTFYVEWMLLMLFVLFAEIFAVGVKIKEEQDLTI